MVQCISGTAHRYKVFRTLGLAIILGTSVLQGCEPQGDSETVFVQVSPLWDKELDTVTVRVDEMQKKVTISTARGGYESHPEVSASTTRSDSTWYTSSCVTENRTHWSCITNQFREVRFDGIVVDTVTVYRRRWQRRGASLLAGGAEFKFDGLLENENERETFELRFEAMEPQEQKTYKNLRLKSASLLNARDLEFLDVTLETPRYSTTYDVVGKVSNQSREQISAIHLTVKFFDCPVKDGSLKDCDEKNAESQRVALDLPSGEWREFRVFTPFARDSRMRGFLRWTYSLDSVFAFVGSK